MLVNFAKKKQCISYTYSIGLQFWVNMKPYTNQPFGPTYIPYTVGVSGKNTFIDQKTSLHKLRPGYHTTIHVIPKILETTSAFNHLELDTRGCKLPQETNGFDSYRSRSQTPGRRTSLCPASKPD